MNDDCFEFNSDGKVTFKGLPIASIKENPSRLGYTKKQGVWVYYAQESPRFFINFIKAKEYIKGRVLFSYIP